MKRKQSNIVIILALLVCSCNQKKIIKENQKHKNDFEKIFPDSHNEKLEAENDVAIYLDSIEVVKRKIKVNISKMRNDDDKKNMYKLIQNDSLVFMNNLESQTDMIYYSYNGYSEGSQGEKSVYSNLYYITSLKNHLIFMKAIDYNLNKKVNIN